MPTPGVYSPIEIVPGVQPSTDATEAATPHYVYADKIRFNGGIPEKIGGWSSISFDYSATINGTARSLFSEMINGTLYNVIGSNTRLYSLIGSRLTNITPFVSTPTAAANSLASKYVTLGSNPLAAVDGSPVVTVTYAGASGLQAGDTIYLSGATGFAGILAGALNGDAIVRSVGSGTFTINVGTNATSTASGGGGSVVFSSGMITLTSVAHGLVNGDRVKIESAATFAGITDTDINKEFIIRNVTTDAFDFVTNGNASSSVSSGGGASTQYYEPMPIGLVDETNVVGYGAGLYGIGLYGTALQSTTARAYPRIWFMDRFGDSIIMTAGNQTGVYVWGGSNNTAPILVANAPTEINYAFISNNILVTFGAEDSGSSVENRIFASDIDDITNWTSSLVNQVYDDDIEGIGRLISHAPVQGSNLIFTEHETLTFRYLGGTAVWEVTTIDESIGIIAPMARVSVKGAAFWMGQENFYMYRGGSVEVIPANNGGIECSCLRYVFDDLNFGQKSKIFAWYNKRYNEVWFHYPTANSMEPNRVVVVNLLDFTWTVHVLTRTAAESPNIKTKNPRLVNVGSLYQHEFGNDADGSALPWTLRSPKRFYERPTININAVIPDSVQSGTINFEAKGYLFPQSVTPTVVSSLSVTSTTEFIPVSTSGRFYQYTWSGSTLGQPWTMGRWYEEIQKGALE